MINIHIPYYFAYMHRTMQKNISAEEVIFSLETIVVLLLCLF